MAKHEKETDGALLLAFNRNGDEGAFTSLVVRHQSMMYRVAFRILGNAQDAQDAMQRSLIVFARRSVQLRQTGSVAAWLHRVVTLQSMALSRKRSTRTTYESKAMNEHLIQTEGLPSSALPELDASIQALRPKDRQAVILHYLEGHSYAAIASRLGGTSEGWRKRCSRALEKLAVKLRSRGVQGATCLTITATIGGQSAQASVSPNLIATMTREALLQKGVAGSVASTSSIALIMMKTKLILLACIAGGVALSFSLERPGKRQTTISNEPPVSTETSKTAGRERGTREFDLDALISAVLRYDEAPKRSNREERRLRMLMFSIPTSDDVKSISASLNEVENTDRFNDIVTALYARWAELDAPAAWVAASEYRFSNSARDGVMLTWLSQDRDEAFEALMKSRENGGRRILVKFLRHEAITSPRQAALFVDQIAKVWPEVDVRLFPLVANSWVIVDPIATADWVASHPDANRRNALLHKLAKRTARESHGLLGMDLANRIDDPEKRAAARLNTLRWFGVASGSLALKDKYARPNRDLRSGFPDDWTSKELSSYARGFMANYIKDYPLLVKVARNEEQRQSIYLGAIQGASFSQPSMVADAVSSLDSAVMESSTDHQKSLKIFITRWNEKDPKGAKSWLNKQPEDSKTRIMKAALGYSAEK